MKSHDLLQKPELLRTATIGAALGKLMGRNQRKIPAGQLTAVNGLEWATRHVQHNSFAGPSDSVAEVVEARRKLESGEFFSSGRTSVGEDTLTDSN